MSESLQKSKHQQRIYKTDKNKSHLFSDTNVASGAWLWGAQVEWHVLEAIEDEITMRVVQDVMDGVRG